MSRETPPYWRLISILFSSFPMTSELALRLHREAFDLYRTDAGAARIDRDSDVIVTGEVRNLKKELALGTFAGPAFEAELETERGRGMVRFLLTHEGLEALSERSGRPMN